MIIVEETRLTQKPLSDKVSKTDRTEAPLGQTQIAELATQEAQRRKDEAILEESREHEYENGKRNGSSGLILTFISLRESSLIRTLREIVS